MDLLRVYLCLKFNFKREFMIAVKFTLLLYLNHLKSLIAILPRSY